MITKVTKGVKISVEPAFETTIHRNSGLQYAFSYKITIDNQSDDTVQLLSRYWEIKDALKNIETVEGEGVVGLKPVLKPKQSHTYTSGCILVSPIGSMGGHYNLLNFSTGNVFKVGIPIFKLDAPFALN